MSHGHVHSVPSNPPLLRGEKVLMLLLVLIFLLDPLETFRRPWLGLYSAIYSGVAKEGRRSHPVCGCNVHRPWRRINILFNIV